jgi:hypothetical protein
MASILYPYRCTYADPNIQTDGFPDPDKQLFEFFSRSLEDFNVAVTLFFQFLQSLFEVVKGKVEFLLLGHSPEYLAMSWQEWLEPPKVEKDQVEESVSTIRINLYDGVIARLRNTVSRPPS